MKASSIKNLEMIKLCAWDMSIPSTTQKIVKCIACNPIQLVSSCQADLSPKSIIPKKATGVTQKY